MKSVEIGEAKGALADYAREAQHETLVVTRRGRPVAAVVPIRGVDMESLALSTNPDFIALIQRARARYNGRDITGGDATEVGCRKKVAQERLPQVYHGHRAVVAPLLVALIAPSRPFPAPLRRDLRALASL